MLSLMVNKVGFSLVQYESCAMGIGIPPLSLNSIENTEVSTSLFTNIVLS